MMKLFLDMLTLSQYKHLFTTCLRHHTDLPTQLCVSSDWLRLLIFPWLLLMTPHWHWHPPAGPGGDLSSVWQESNRYRVTAGGQHWTWAMSCRERPGKWELWAAPAQTQDNGQTNNQSRKCHTIFVISDYSLDIVDSALLIRGRLPSEGESPAPAAVPRGVRGKPARAARHVAEIKES